MRKISVKQYAKEHKKSIFEVIKMIQKGELKSEEATVAGIKTRYIILEDNLQPKKSLQKDKTEENLTNSLKIEIIKLQQEINQLKNIIQECCKSLNKQ